MKVAEIFKSMSGEVGGSIPQGSVVTFIRFSGCPLKCKWCDTPESWKKYESAYRDMGIEEILEEIKSHGNKNIIVTGGEPLYQKEFPEFITALASYAEKIQIETSGAFAYFHLRSSPEISDKLSFVVDYKPVSAKVEGFPHVVSCRDIWSKDVLNFPVQTDQDLARALVKAENLYDQKVILGLPMPIISFSPIFPMKSEKILDAVKPQQYSAVINIQLHKMIGVK